MRSLLLGVIAGAAVLQRQADLPAYAAEGLLAALAASLLALLLQALSLQRAMREPLLCRPFLRFAFGCLLGFFWAGWQAQIALEPVLAKADEGRDFIVTGMIDNLPYRFERGTRFNLAVEEVVDASHRPLPPATVPPRIVLSWYAGRFGEAHAIGDVQPGERWRFKVRLQRPHGNANPHGFDYELWLLEQGVRATGYVRDDGGNRRLSSFVFSAHNVVEYCRSVLRDKIQRILNGKPYAGVIVALVVGDQRAIAQADWQVFNRTGISHLISISGLHITMIAGLAAWLVSWLWRHSFFTQRQLPLLLPAQKLAAIAGWLAGLLYVLLAGFGVPAQRTLYMLSVIAVALWCGRLTAVSHVLALAAGIVVLLDPWAVQQPGFWLSFGAVAIILYASVGRTTHHKNEAQASEEAGMLSPAEVRRRKRRGTPLTRRQRIGQGLREALNTQYAVTLGLVPLTMLLFAQVSLISPVANAVAIPLVSLVVTPMALLGSFLPDPLAGPLLLAAHENIRMLAAGLRWLSGFEFSVWTAPMPPWWLFAWTLAGTLWLLAPRGWPTRWLGLASWLPLLAAEPVHPQHGELQVTAFDVGQGMALLLETSGHRLLYDTGPAYAPDADGGNRVIVPYLRARGIGQLDGLVVSHSDTDHSGGALTVMQNVQVRWLLSSLPDGHAALEAARQHRRCEAGQSWQWDGVHFEVLHPAAASYADGKLKTNARSCVLRVSTGTASLLLAGDIEADQEAELLRRAGETLRADVLLAPHHGSGTSSTPAFLAAVRPSIAIFQAGYRNRYRHPKPEVYARYAANGVRRLRSDESGAITLRFTDKMEVEEYRKSHARYWYGP
ncbi:DNA internalization-related competence protein ComEC/Rec2 [Massilia sp. YIM B04103]|uniref:DNA internalization-related competence protein ComEC/Rec2 n=1 Tax=Massilia sp. YIM B04103 TaxID=2963106 RepID=UPI00210C8A86|nr:DNA internalization-related competence protein ComEC/Rec2 [Massilia sp. YIM B04103]